MKSKAAMTLTVALILGVAVTAILILIYNKVGGLRCVKDPWNCLQKKTIVELASECAYARCVHGCNSPEVMSIKGKDFDCQEQCEQDLRGSDEDEKICDFGRPIEIELEKPTYLRQENIPYNCIFAHHINTDPDFNNYVDLAQDIVRYKDSPYPIFIDPALISNFDEQNGCYAPLVSDSSLGKVEIVSGKIYVGLGIVGIWGVGGMGEAVCIPFYFEYISNTPFYQPPQSGKIISTINGEYYSLDGQNGIIVNVVNEINEIYEICSGQHREYPVNVICDGESVSFCFKEEKEVCNGAYKLKLITLNTGHLGMWYNNNKYCNPIGFQII